MPQTPSTLAYIEETKLSGLPVIPFAYPTCVIVEKMKSKTKERVRSDSEDSSSPEPPRGLGTGNSKGHLNKLLQSCSATDSINYFCCLFLWPTDTKCKIILVFYKYLNS